MLDLLKPPGKVATKTRKPPVKAGGSRSRKRIPKGDVNQLFMLGGCGPAGAKPVQVPEGEKHYPIASADCRDLAAYKAWERRRDAWELSRR